MSDVSNYVCVLEEEEEEEERGDVSLVHVCV